MLSKKIISSWAAFLIGAYVTTSVTNPVFAAPQSSNKAKKAKRLKIKDKREKITSPLSVPQEKAMTLKEVLEFVYQNHPKLQAARAETRANDESIAKAKAGWLPELNAKGTADVSKSKQNVGQSYKLPSNTASITLSQRIFDLGATNANILSAQKGILAQEASYANTEQEVLLNAIVAYISVLRDIKGLQIAHEQEKVFSENYRYDRARFEVGQLTKADLDLTKARLEGSLASVTTAEGNLANSQATFLEAVGRAPDHLIMPSSFKKLPKALEDIKAEALKKNPSLLAALYGLEAAKSSANAAYGSIQPSANVQVSGSRSVRPYGPQEGSTTTGEIMAVLNIPLYQSANHADIRQKQETVIAKKLALNYAYLSVTHQAITAWTNLITAQAKVKQLEAQVSATAESVDRYKEEEKAGAGDIFRRLEVEQNLYNYRQQLNQTQADVLINQYKILAIMGDLNPEKLELTATAYDPQENYKRTRGTYFGFKTAEMEKISPEETSTLEIPADIQKELENTTRILPRVQTKTVSTAFPEKALAKWALPPEEEKIDLFDSSERLPVPVVTPVDQKNDREEPIPGKSSHQETLTVPSSLEETGTIKIPEKAEGKEQVTLEAPQGTS